MRIEPSPYAEPGIAVCTCAGQVVWVGRIADLAEAGVVDIVHCHDGDAEAIRARFVTQNVLPRRPTKAGAAKP